MKLDASLLTVVKNESDVVAGNIYPAKGGRRNPGTEWWLVVSTSTHGAHCLGFDADGNPCSTASYNKGALRERPICSRVDLSTVTLKVMP